MTEFFRKKGRFPRIYIKGYSFAGRQACETDYELSILLLVRL